MTQTLTQDKFEAQIDELAQGIKNMKRRTDMAKEDVKTALNSELDTLLERADTLKRELADARTKGQTSWEELRGGMEKAWVELKEGVRKAQARFQ